MHSVRTVDTAITIDELIVREELSFVGRMTNSSRQWEAAKSVLAGGTTSSWMMSRPVPTWIERASGSRIWDLDGTEYIDLHGGYGANVVGHAHPAVVEAVQRQVTRGTHYAQPVTDAVEVAEELARRFGVPMWRFTNSGTEATMDAVHLMRATTGRELIIKVEGSYHGHHDSVMVSMFRNADALGPVEDPWRRPGGGVPQRMADLVRIVAFNDLAALEQVLDAHAGQIAGMILEPMMMNASIIRPEPGYLAGVRDLLHRHGALLAFDEVKTGLTIHHGGVTGLYGVTPDLVCLAKALGGGLPCGAIGGTREVMAAITDGRYDQVGTFNGNPLTMAAAKATLYDVLTPESYVAAELISQRMLDESVAALAEHGIGATGHAHGFKGSLLLNPRPVVNYREFLAVNTAMSHCHWLFQSNGGVFLPPYGKSEQWTLSVQHSEDDGLRYAANVRRFAQAAASITDRSSRIFAIGSYT